jgi:hypothetical protein
MVAPRGIKGEESSVFQVGEVMAYADGFGRAVVRQEKELIALYVNPGDEVRVSKVLERLPQPIEAAEVLQVELSEAGQWLSLMRFVGRREQVRLRTVWVQKDEAILIRAARLCGHASRQLEGI